MSNWTDAQLLRLLDMRKEGLSFGEIAKATGRSRMAIIGVVHRINKETDKHDISPHLNGTMPRHWWKKGLAKQ